MHREATRNGRWRWKIPRQALVQGLRAGHSLSEIARAHGANQSTASRAVRSLSVTELSAIVVGRSQPSTSASLSLPAPDLDSPIDIREEAIAIGEDLRALRKWLTSDDAEAALKTPQRISFVISLFDKRIAWIDSILDQRERIGKLIGMEELIGWMQDTIHAEDYCPKCGTTNGIVDRVNARSRAAHGAPRDGDGGGEAERRDAEP